MAHTEAFRMDVLTKPSTDQTPNHRTDLLNAPPLPSLPSTSSTMSPSHSHSHSHTDTEAHWDAADVAGLYNDIVSVFQWHDISAVLPARGSQPEKKLLDHVNGIAKAGEMIAIMGPSGSGKTMLLNRLAHRAMPPKAKLTGEIQINDVGANLSNIRQTSSYVEQADHLIGSITTKETLMFAAKLGLQEPISKTELALRVDRLLHAFGLDAQADMIIGTPIQKGLSGGQKRRVSVASQLITSPRILFLDEPTSGLDSVASYEIVSYLKAVALANNLIVIASIHQPSTKTFNAFDRVYLLARGKLCYGGLRTEITPWFDSIGLGMPAQTNPAEWLLELVDTDFSRDREQGQRRLDALTSAWAAREKDCSPAGAKGGAKGLQAPAPSRRRMLQPVHLLHRNFIKSYRDVLAFWIRVVMYTCLAILMGTTWLRLDYSQDAINARITALFFSGAFLSFMAVAYIPAYIEDQATFFKERANGLYGSLPFQLANFTIGLPYLFIIVMAFSLIAYWLVGLWPTASGFWTFVTFLFLDLLAAESLVVLIASLVPNFIVALALTAFANGLWMVTNGFLVPETILNVFWRSWVTKINYQNWTFRAMMWNEFRDQTFTCGPGANCAFPSMDGKVIQGRAVLAYYGYDDGALGRYAGYTLAIVVVYRVLAWAALALRR